MNERRSKPVTLILRAKNAADLKKISDVEEALSRQVGWNVKLDTVVVDASGNEYRTVGWPMNRQDQAAVAMLLRRGKKPNDPALLVASEIEQKSPVLAHAARGLTKKN